VVKMEWMRCRLGFAFTSSGVLERDRVTSSAGLLLVELVDWLAGWTVMPSFRFSKCQQDSLMNSATPVVFDLFSCGTP